MSQSPRRDERTLNLDADSSDELERLIIAVNTSDTPAADQETVTSPPGNRRCDSAHRELLRQPFSTR